MACPSCEKRSAEAKLRVISPRTTPQTLLANDIEIVADDEVRPFVETDWPTDKHVLLIFIPEAFTPVCKTELGALNQWYDAFQELGCELMAVCTDPAAALLEWVSTEPLLASPRYKLLSSYLLPARLGILENRRAKRASVFMMQDGEVVTQQHFAKVGRSFEELHRMLYGYSTGSYCAAGWHSPADGFLQ